MNDLVIESTTDFAVIRELLLEYATTLQVDLSFQKFDDEIKQLDTFYEVILIARFSDEPAGCVALRRLEPHICEMKRLFVRETFRGLGIGKALAEAVIAEARQRGYAQMRLDTLPIMHTAMALYEALGFQETAAYRFNPIEGSRFMELTL